MSIEYWIRPGACLPKIIDGTVCVECKNGDQRFKLFTTIHGLRLFIQKANRMLDGFEVEQRGKIRNVGH